MHLAMETNHSLPRSRKQNTEIAVGKIINKRKINRILYLVFIVLLVLVIPAQGSNLATENQTSIGFIRDKVNTEKNSHL